MRHRNNLTFRKHKIKAVILDNTLGHCTKYLSRVNKQYASCDTDYQLIPHNFRKSKRLSKIMEKKLLKVSSFNQTSSEVYLELHLGRRVQTNEIQVTFTSDDVSVGLTSDGRTFNYTFPHPVLKNQCKAQLKKMKLLLVISKANEILWSTFENDNSFLSPAEKTSKVVNSRKKKKSSSKANIENISDNNMLNEIQIPTFLSSKLETTDLSDVNLIIDTNTTNSSLISPFKVDILSDINQDLKKSILYTSCDFKNDSISSSEIFNKLEFDSKLNTAYTENIGNVSPTEILEFDSTKINQCEILMTNKDVKANKSCEVVDLQVPSTDLEFCTDNDFSEGGDLLLQCYSVDDKMDVEQENKISTMSQDVRIISDLKMDFTEMDDFKLTVHLYIRGVINENLQINFCKEDFSVQFCSRDEKFLNRFEAATENTHFKFKIDLIYPINTINSTYTLRDSCIEVILIKVTPGKWRGFNKLQHIKKAELSPTVINENFTSRSVNLEDKSQKNQRPTCMVSPLNVEIPPSYPMPMNGHILNSNSFIHRPIGRVGLDNMGNTCFMNSIIQVLSNTVDLRNYFLNGLQLKELNTSNQLGMGGKLATAFGVLIKGLWTENTFSIAPTKLKTLIAQKQSRFVGYSQHDAEEFMEFLLDGLHEDLNRIILKPYIPDTVECSEKNVKEAADETWRRHKSRNNSVIVDIFQGQYYSKVKCPKCSKVSITFDPFSVVQVPIPNKNKKSIIVYFMPKQYSLKPCKYKFLIDCNGTVEHLIDLLRKHNPYLSKSNIRVMEINKSRVVSILGRGSNFSRIIYNDILACEVLSEENVGEPVVELLVEQKIMVPSILPRVCSYCNREHSSEFGITLKRCMRCFKISYCGQECQRADWGRHKTNCNVEGESVGWPFILSYPKSNIHLNQLSFDADALARYSVNVFCPPLICNLSSSSLDESHIESTDGKSPKLFDSVSLKSPNTLDLDAIILDQNELNQDNKFFSPDVVFNAPTINSNVQDENGSGDFTREVPTRCVLGQQQKPPLYKESSFQFRPIYSSDFIKASTDQFLTDRGDKVIDLNGLQKLYMVWNNHDKSKNHVIVATKQFDCDENDTISEAINESKTTTLADCLTLFSEPEILTADQTWFCSRCKIHCQATKEMSLWRLPPTLIIHLKRFSFSGFLWRDKIDDFIDFPIRNLDMTPYCRNIKDGNSYLYDLYGVVNHHGSLLGGHYNAYARCFSEDDPGWRLFDDSNVTLCPESKVVSQSAYVLFYRRVSLENEFSNSPINYSDLNLNINLSKEDLESDIMEPSNNLSNYNLTEQPMEPVLNLQPDPQLDLVDTYIDEVD